MAQSVGGHEVVPWCSGAPRRWDQHSFRPGPSHHGPDTVIAAQCSAQMRHVGQMRQLVLVASPQPP